MEQILPFLMQASGFAAVARSGSYAKDKIWILRFERLLHSPRLEWPQLQQLAGFKVMS